MLFMNEPMLKKGDSAPEYLLPDQDNKERKLADQQRKWTVIYFYPKDDTPGCTTEACAIRDIYNDFMRMGVDVIGVSKDSPESHKQFAEKYELPFTLLSDKDGEMINAYKAWGKKSWFGKEIEGIKRVSYLVSPDLTIARIYPKVDPTNHALELLTDLKDAIAEN